jgi:hypothetical protein
MDKAAFKRQVSRAAPNGTIFPNPGGGISKIVNQSDSNIYYKRGRSTIGMQFDDLFDVWNRFQSKEISSGDLRIYRPAIFDSSKNGHSCNCTFLFTLLYAAGLAGKMSGGGVRGNPFRARLLPAQRDPTISDV